MRAARRQAGTGSAICRPPGPGTREHALPGLGDVRADELLAALVNRHRLSATGAARALELGILMAGYPPDTDAVLAADALDIIDWALRLAG